MGCHSLPELLTFKPAFAFLFSLQFFGSNKWVSLWPGGIGQREDWLLVTVPLQLHVESAGEGPYGRVSPCTSSLYHPVFWLLRLDKELVKPESLMALLEGCALHIKRGVLLACLFSNPFIKSWIPRDAKASWHSSQVPGDWLGNDGQGGTSVMAECSALLPQAPRHTTLLVNPSTSILKLDEVFIPALSRRLFQSLTFRRFKNGL